MNIIGICPSHDSSSCLVIDGKVKKYYKEERLNRIKRSFNPINSIKKCTEGLESIDCFSYSAPTSVWPNKDKDIYLNNELNSWVEFISKTNNIKSVHDFSNMHHKQHASSSFYSSGFDEAAVIIIDGRGSHFGSIAETETIFYASYPDNFIELYKGYEKTFRFDINDVKSERKRLPDCEIEVESNLGLTSLYCTATNLINQSFLENGKTMGLSAYGDKNKEYEDLLISNKAIVDPSNFFSYWDESKNHAYMIATSLDRQEELQVECMYHKNYYHKNGNVDENNYQMYADYALHVQKTTERAVEILVSKALEKTGSKNICFGGGYALNVVNNLNLLKKFPGVRFFFDPMSDDGGASIGGALLSYRSISKDKRIYQLKNNFIHGTEHSLDKIGGKDIDYYDISKLLNDKKTVAMYYGLAEAGPRSLGHRSILFDPRVEDGKKIVNMIKKREWYRPFAASMLKEDADKYFYYVDNIGYKYMTINADARPGVEKIIPSVIHKDGTCRIHIVEDEDEPLFHVLHNFKKITGIGILLNTSFNLAGDPLVETPEEAIVTWKYSDLDFLWFPKIKKILSKKI